MKASAEKKKFDNLVRDMNIAMMVTRTPNGQLHGRPMWLLDVDAGGNMTFLTSLETGKVNELARDPSVALTFQKGGAYLSVSGAARVVDDPERVRELWKPLAGIWFDGADDPNIALIVVSSVSAEYWDAGGARGLKFAFEAVKSMLTNERPQTDATQHGSVLL